MTIVFPKAHRLWLCVFLLLATIAVYWPVSFFDFISYDDPDYVTENAHVREGINLKNIAWAFTATTASNYHPLTWLSHMTDVQLFGLNPGAHHLTNIFFHLVNVLLLFLIMYRMSDALWQSFFTAALFGLHPLHVESVAWISERKDVLSAMFWLLTMWSYIRYIARPKLTRYMLILLCFGLGLLAKPMLVTLPFVLLLLDFWPLNRFNNATGKIPAHLLWEKLPLLLLVAGSCIVTYHAQQQNEALVSFASLSLPYRVANSVSAYTAYLGKTFWPVHLAVFYPHPGHEVNWLSAGGSLVSLIAVSFFVIRCRHNMPYLVVGWLWFLGTLVPVIGLVQVGDQAMADRYTYIPLIGIFIGLSWAIPHFMKNQRSGPIAMSAGAGFVLLALMASTCNQLLHWRNDLTLFSHAIMVTENNYFAHHMTGKALSKQGRIQEAITHFDAAAQILPSFKEAHNNIGILLARQGKMAAAIQHFTIALEMDPLYSEARNNLERLIKR